MRYKIYDKDTMSLLSIVNKFSDLKPLKNKVKLVVYVENDEGNQIDTIGYCHWTGQFESYENCYADVRNGCTKVGLWVSGYCPSCDDHYKITVTADKMLGNLSSDSDDSISTEYDDYVYID